MKKIEGQPGELDEDAPLSTDELADAAEDAALISHAAGSTTLEAIRGGFRLARAISGNRMMGSAEARRLASLLMREV